MAKNNDSSIIFFPNVQQLKQEVDDLRHQAASLIVEREDLTFVTCRQIEAQYFAKLGNLENDMCKQQDAFLRLKRKTELVKAALNRRITPNLQAIEDMLDDEFADTQKKLHTQCVRRIKAEHFANGLPISQEEHEELKQHYLQIVMCVHPNICHTKNPTHPIWYVQAVESYSKLDLKAMRLICEIVTDRSKDAIVNESSALLRTSHPHLLNLIDRIHADIAQIKNSYPYTLLELLHDEGRQELLRSNYLSAIKEYDEQIAFYSAQLDDLLKDIGA